MKSRHTKFAALLIAVLIGVGIWWTCFRKPSIRFVHFRINDLGYRVAVFRATNTTSRPFHYAGQSPNQPFYSYRLRNKSDWETLHPGWCGNGAGSFILAPHSSMDFDVLVDLDAEYRQFTSGVFAAGVEFYSPRGQVLERLSPDLAEAIQYLRYRWLPQTKPTWSKPAPWVRRTE